MRIQVRCGGACAAVLAVVLTWSVQASADSSPPPWMVFPAVPSRAFAGMLDTNRDTDIVSPAGIDAVLCALAPVMSDAALRQRRHAIESDCGPMPTYIARSIWFSRELSPDRRGEALLQAEIHHEAAPLNSAIDRWLRARGALAPSGAGPIEFAAVSALDFEGTWAFPFRWIQPRPFTFHGKKRDARVRFLFGRQLATVGDRNCVRGVMPIVTGGVVVVTEIANRPIAEVMRCLSGRLDPAKLVNAHFFIPQVTLRRTASIRDRLERLGVRDAFTSSADPLPKLLPRRGLTYAIQAAELAIDWRGIRVRATTEMSVPLSGPIYEAVLVYDRPFAMRVVDERGTTVAVALVNDL